MAWQKDYSRLYAARYGENEPVWKGEGPMPEAGDIVEIKLDDEFPQEIEVLAYVSFRDGNLLGLEAIEGGDFSRGAHFQVKLDRVLFHWKAVGSDQNPK